MIPDNVADLGLGGLAMVVAILALQLAAKAIEKRRSGRPPAREEESSDGKEKE